VRAGVAGGDDHDDALLPQPLDAWLSGSTAGSWVLSVPQDRLSTRMPYWSA
jgi:hypothetical protein